MSAKNDLPLPIRNFVLSSRNILSFESATHSAIIAISNSLLVRSTRLSIQLSELGIFWRAYCHGLAVLDLFLHHSSIS